MCGTRPTLIFLIFYCFSYIILHVAVCDKSHNSQTCVRNSYRELHQEFERKCTQKVSKNHLGVRIRFYTNFRPIWGCFWTLWGPKICQNRCQRRREGTRGDAKRGEAAKKRREATRGEARRGEARPRGGRACGGRFWVAREGSAPLIRGSLPSSTENTTTAFLKLF